MDSRRKARLVENAINQCDTVVCNQDIGPASGEARACESCGQAFGSRSEPLGNLDAFPAGVKFDPSDEELLHHLRAEIGYGNGKPHPLINHFISVLDGEDGICQVHPKHLPGVKKDGSSKHFFHRPAKAYTTGTRKRRKIHSEDGEPGVETRWHKTGKTRKVSENERTLGWKKIMVLYRNTGAKKSKPEKTNWILHQYHLGETEEETDGELVVCKVFYQKQPRQCTGGRQAEGATNEMENVDLNHGSKDLSVTCISEVSRGTPVTPKVDTPHRPRSLRADPTGRMRGQMTAQSSKGSELTVIGMEGQAPVASELTSTPAHYSTEMPPLTPAGTNFPNGVRMISPLVKTIHPTIAECYSGEWNDAYEEVSTSAGKSCQNETDNQVGGGIGLMEREQDEPHQFPIFGGESQQQYEHNDVDLLICEELMTDMDFSYDFESIGEEPFFSNPNEDYPEYPDLTASLPSLDSEYLLSSQEANGIIDCCKATYTNLDNDDSLSST